MHPINLFRTCSLLLLTSPALCQVVINLRLDYEESLSALTHTGNTKAQSLLVDASAEPALSTLESSIKTEDCGGPDDVFQFSTLTVEPDPIPVS